MEYDNVDKNVAYKAACENVKKIANAIKAIKIKYYLNFSQITEGDNQIYQELNAQMEQISSQHGLEKLKTALMEDISSKYDGKDIKDLKNRDLNDPEARNEYYEEIKQAYFGAMEVESRALREGNSGLCLECQKKRNEYIEIFRQNEDGKTFEEEVKKYAREVLGELAYSKENLQKANESKMKFLENCHKTTNSQERKEAGECFVQAQKVEVQQKEGERV